MSSSHGRSPAPEPDDVPDATPDPGVPEPAQVTATWNAPLWGRKRGHTETLALTPIVEGAASGGYLSLTTPGGQPVVPRPPARRTAAHRRAPVPPSARAAASAGPRTGAPASSRRPAPGTPAPDTGGGGGDAAQLQARTPDRRVHGDADGGEPEPGGRTRPASRRGGSGRIRTGRQEV